jgi:hypothetical protein
VAIKEQIELELSKFRAQLAAGTADLRTFRRQGEKEMEGFGKSLFKGVGEELKNSLHEGIGALGAGAGILGGIELFKGTLEHYDNIHDVAAKLGESTEVVQRVGEAAKLSGLDVNGLAGAMLKLEKNLGEVDNAKGTAALEHFGLTAQGLMQMPLDEKILALSGAFDEARTTGVGYADLLALLGKTAGEMIPLLSEGKEGIQSMFDGASVLADAEVQRLAALNDEFDHGTMKVKAWTAECVNAVVGLGQFLAEAGKGGIGSAFEKLGSDNQAAQSAAAQKEQQRQAGAEAIQQAREAAAAEELQKKAIEDGNKALEHRKQLLEKIEAAESAIRHLKASMGDSVDQSAALEADSAALMKRKNATGGQFFEDSAAGLEQWAAALGGSGMVDEQEQVLKLLKEQLEIVKQQAAITKSGFDDAAKNATEVYKELDRLKTEGRKGEEKLMTPRQRLAALKSDLDNVMGHETDRKRIPTELGDLKNQAIAEEQAGNSEAAVAIRKQINAAQAIMEEMAGTEDGSGKKAAPGGMANAINRILGKSSSDMVADEAKKTNNFLSKWDGIMRKLDARLAKPDAPPQNIWIDGGRFTAP